LGPDLSALADYDRAHHTTGLTLFAVGPEGVKVRSFAPADGIAEDPVCGSGNAAVAAYRLLRGALADGQSYQASQGREVGRDGEIYVRISGRDVYVGGQCVTCVSGMIRL
jgi:PhzF family phenazine biosynthesis protein